MLEPLSNRANVLSRPQKQPKEQPVELSKFATEVMCHLSVSEWKTGFELTQEIGATWKKEGRRKVLAIAIAVFWPDLAEEAQRPSAASIYPALTELESQGLAEARWRNDPPDPNRLYRRREYHLTEKGHRVRASLLREVSDPQGLPVPVPM